jgi:type II secretory pathway component PulF
VKQSEAVEVIAMDERTSDVSLTRRQVLTGGAIALAGVGALGDASQAQLSKTKQVPVYVTDEELETWTLNVVASLSEGLPLIKIFELAGAKTKNESLQRFSADASDILVKGYVLSDLMEINRHIFNREYVTTVRYGEIYGEVDAALEKWLKSRPKRENKG